MSSTKKITFEIPDVRCKSPQDIFNYLQSEQVPDEIKKSMQQLSKKVSDLPLFNKALLDFDITNYFNSQTKEPQEHNTAYTTLIYATAIKDLISDGTIEIICTEGDEKSNTLKKLVLELVDSAINRAKAIEDLHKIHTAREIIKGFKGTDATSDEIYEAIIKEGTHKEFIISITFLVLDLYWFEERDELMKFIKKYSNENISDDENKRLLQLKEITDIAADLIQRNKNRGF